MKQLSYIVSEYWPRQDLNKWISVKVHNLKDKGQKVKMTHKPHIRLICPENMKQLSFIVSKQWAGQDFQDNNHNVKV